MDNDSQAIAVGLGAGLGGFIGFLIVGCICWHIFCGTWCDKKKPPPPATHGRVKQHQHVTSPGYPNQFPDKTVITISNHTNADKKRVHPQAEFHASSNDLAAHLKSVRR